MQRFGLSWQEVSTMRAKKQPIEAALPKRRVPHGMWDIDKGKTDIGKVDVGHR
jgi:hypothetical protein